WAVLLRLRDQGASGLFQAQTIRDIRCHWLDLHADPAACHGAVVAQLRDNALDRVGRNVERDADRATGRREDRGVDADDITVNIESRAAGIAFVHRRVDLNEIVIGARTDIAAARRDDTGCDGAAEAERITDGEHPVTDSWGRFRELHEWKIIALDLDEGEIGARVGTDDLCRIS